MPGDTSHARIDGDRRVLQLLSEMQDRASGIPPQVWLRVGDVVAEGMKKQFDTEGAYLTGHQWAPLQPDYLRWKVRHGFDPRRLHQTGEMRRSLTDRPMAVEHYERMSATFGTNDPKAPYHQFGTRFMPQRKIIEVDTNPDLADDVNSVLARYIFEDRLR